MSGDETIFTLSVGDELFRAQEKNKNLARMAAYKKAVRYYDQNKTIIFF